MADRAKYVIVLLGALVAAVLVGGAPAEADDKEVEAFYRGKQIDLIIGSAPGGGYDAYARLVARYMGKYIPGNPILVPKNMPGAGSARSASYLYKIAPKDGTALTASSSGALVDPLFNPATRDQYDPTKFEYLGSANNEVALCEIWHAAPVLTMDDALKKETIVGASQTGGSSADFAASLVNVLGAKLKIVAGYEGSKDMLLAMERGEISGICGQLWSSIATASQDWIRDKKIVFWVQMALKPHPDLPDVPMVWNYVKSDHDRRVLELIYGQLVFGRPYFLPPGVPQDRVAALRTAFAKTMQDEDYKREAGKEKLEVNPVGGAEIQALIEKMYAADPAIAKAAADAQKLPKLN
jgi:tripartite-type tricarboxylate transporter receptor subunit TctC